MGERERGAQGAPHDGAWGAGGGRPRPAAPGRPAKRDGKPDPTASVSRCAVRLGCQGRLRAPGRPLPTQGAALDSATGAPEGGGGRAPPPFPSHCCGDGRAGAWTPSIRPPTTTQPMSSQLVGLFRAGSGGGRVPGWRGWRARSPGARPERARRERERCMHTSGPGRRRHAPATAGQPRTLIPRNPIKMWTIPLAEGRPGWSPAGRSSRALEGVAALFFFYRAQVVFQGKAGGCVRARTEATPRRFNQTV